MALLFGLAYDYLVRLTSKDINNNHKVEYTYLRNGSKISTIQVGNAAANWGLAGGRNPVKNMNEHFKKHVLYEQHDVLGKNVLDYTNNAKSFYYTNKDCRSLSKCDFEKQNKDFIFEFLDTFDVYGKESLLKMKNIIFTKDEILIFNIFLKYSIPECIKWEIVNNYDLMECYEEMFNYLNSIIDKEKIDLDKNSYGTGKAIIFDNSYENVLIKVIENGDYEIKEFCYLTLTILAILKKHLDK